MISRAPGVTPVKLALLRAVAPSMSQALQADGGRVDVASDAPLLARLRAADPAAIDVAYRAHHAELRAFAQRVIGDRHAAEDLVHDVFLALPVALRGFRGEGSLRAFLIGIAANRCGRHVRAAARRRAAHERFAHHADTQPARDSSGLDERVVALQRALDRLPLAQRTALVLCEVEERTAPEVALILAIPESTVRTRCFHARRNLMRFLQRAPREAR